MSRTSFDHETLLVYQKTLAFAGVAIRCAVDWPKGLAVTDQFSRASESSLINLASAVSQRTADSKSAGLDCSLGSILECAACLDIAHILGLLCEEAREQTKLRLAEIARMLVGLRKSWNRQVREAGAEYEVDEGASGPHELFSHERLDVYRVALDFVRWFAGRSTEMNNTRIPQRIDATMTGMVLNIAEGNGRFSVTDHRRFVHIAEQAAIKTAAYLDLAVVGEALERGHAAEGKALLVRVVSMLVRMRAAGSPED